MEANRATDITALNKFPDWFKATVYKRTFYHKEISLQFNLVKDPYRFADGAAFFCKVCGKPAYCRCDYSDEQKVFIVTKIFCHLGCHNFWSLPVEPLWVRMMEDWDVSTYH